MIDFKVIILGITIFVSFLLNAAGVFTPGFIISHTTYFSAVDVYNQRNPFNYENSAWFITSAWLMFGAFAIYIATVIIYIIVFFKTKEDGFRRHLRFWYFLIFGLSVLAIVLSVASVTIAGINCGYNYYFITLRLGYSAWLCVAAAVLTVASVGLSGYIAIKECRD